MIDSYRTQLFDNGNLDAEGGRFEFRLTPGNWDIALRGDVAADDGQP